MKHVYEQYRIARGLPACALLALALAMAQPALALTFRSWVSHNGHDTSDCSIDHPCRTFQRAHDVTYPEGEVDVLDAGEYGTVRINHPITIDGGNLAYVNNIVAVTIDSTVAGTVILRNFSIATDASDRQIDWYGGNLHMENVTNGKVNINPRYGFLVDATSTRHLYMHNTTITVTTTAVYATLGTNPGRGAQLLPVEVTIDHCKFEGITGYSNYPTLGIDLEFGRARVTNSVITGFDKAVVAGAGVEIDLADSSITNSVTAVSVHGVSTDVGGGTVRLAGNNIHGNTNAFSVLGGGQIISFGNNRIAGNSNNETPTSTIALK